MSRAGVYSSIGDEYQDLVAAYWVTLMLGEPDISKIEIDATSLSTAGAPFSVDDVVIFHKSGHVTCCQCKKNHPKHKTWNAGSLKDELKKAWKQWRDVPDCSILFYSQNNFGNLERLSERSRVHNDLASFRFELPPDLDAEFQAVASLGAEESLGGHQTQSPNMDETFHFIRSLHFIPYMSEHIRDQSLNMLRHSVTHAEKAFEEILKKVSYVTRRSIIEEHDRGLLYAEGSTITRDNLCAFLRDRGIVVTPLKSEEELRCNLDSISSRGRIWQRKIDGRRIERKETSALLGLVSQRKDMILLLGEPGSGKTCILLDLLETLEKDDAVYPIFIQTRDITQDELNDFANNVARMAELRQVVVIADSLDVLSITRDSASLRFFLSLLTKIKTLDNVSVVASCRTFDHKYDTRLSSIEHSALVTVAPLSYETEIIPLFEILKIAHEHIEDDQKILLTNPRMLSMYVDLIHAGGETKAVTWLELSEAYLETLVLQDPDLNGEAYKVLKKIAMLMLEKRRLVILKPQADLTPELNGRLMSANILIETEHGNYAFGHQSMVDLLCVAQAIENNMSMTTFIQRMRPVPFIRPTIRTFFFYLRNHDAESFRKQVRAVLDSENIAFHLKRLVATSLAEIIPSDDDWHLVRHLFRNHKETFFTWFFVAIHIETWFYFIEKFLAPEWIEKQEQDWLFQYLRQLSACPRIEQRLLVEKWYKVLHCGFIDKLQAVRNATIALTRMNKLEVEELRNVFTTIIENPDKASYDMLGAPICKWIETTDSNDDVLWRYITRDVTDENLNRLENVLHCAPHYFEKNNFLENRMVRSEEFLSSVIDLIQTWSHKLTVIQGFSYARHHFLRNTSHEVKRSKDSYRHVDSLDVIFSALENSCKNHAIANSSWWKSHAEMLVNSQEAALRYIGLLCLAEVPEKNINLVKDILNWVQTNGMHPFGYEMTLFLSASAPYLSDDDLELLQKNIHHIYDDEKTDALWILRIKRNLLLGIPACYRTEESQGIIDDANKVWGEHDRNPDATSWGGYVFSPISSDQFLSFTKNAVFKILQHYNMQNYGERLFDDFGVGGPGEVAHQLAEATSRDPLRFLVWGKEMWLDIASNFREAILEGAGRHVRYRFGNLKSASNWEAVSEPEPEVLLPKIISILDECSLEGIREYSLANVLEACSDIAVEKADVEYVCVHLNNLSASSNPSLESWDCKQDAHHHVGLGSTRGIVASATVVMANHWLESHDEELPQSLVELLHRLASDEHPAVRSMLLMHLPYFISKSQDIGWELFDSCVTLMPRINWEDAYGTLYHFYHQFFDRIQKYLSIMEKSAMPQAGKSWGMLMTLSYLSDKLCFADLHDALKRVDLESAWVGVAEVFSYNITELEVKEKCRSGLDYLMKTAQVSNDVLHSISRVFNEVDGKYTSIPLSLIDTYFAYATKIQGKNRISLFHFPDWLNGICEEDCELALSAAEILLEKAFDADLDITINDKFAVLLTFLFREAEEREEADCGKMLQRVIALQDSLLEKGVRHIETWLQEAERP